MTMFTKTIPTGKVSKLAKRFHKKLLPKFFPETTLISYTENYTRNHDPDLSFHLDLLLGAYVNLV